MKKILVLFCCINCFVFVLKGQVSETVEWTFSAKKIKLGFYELHLTAEVEDGWNIYSQWTPKGGPLPTSITFSPNDNVLLGGKAKEMGMMRIKYEPVFRVDVHYFNDKVDFVQVIKLKTVKPDILKGRINYMTCDKSQCVTDDVEFTINLK